MIRSPGQLLPQVIVWANMDFPPGPDSLEPCHNASLSHLSLSVIHRRFEVPQLQNFTSLGKTQHSTLNWQLVNCQVLLYRGWWFQKGPGSLAEICLQVVFLTSLVTLAELFDPKLLEKTWILFIYFNRIGQVSRKKMQTWHYRVFRIDQCGTNVEQLRTGKLQPLLSCWVARL